MKICATCCFSTKESTCGHPYGPNQHETVTTQDTCGYHFYAKDVESLPVDPEDNVEDLSVVDIEK